MALYKRPGSKYYWMKFTFDGELVQKSTNVANKRDAQTIESAYRTQLALGKIGIKPRAKAPTFNQAADDFLAWSKLRHAQKPRSFARKEFSCRPLKKFFGEKPVDRIEPKDIEKFIAWRHAQTSRKTGLPVTPDSINLELVVLKSIFKRLVAAKVLIDNPTDGIKRLAENEKSFHVITPEEERRYLLACPPQLQDLAVVMIETGMRPAEVINLRRELIRLEKGFLEVTNGKTKSSNRKVWLTARAAKIFRARLAKFAGAYLFPKDDADNLLPAAFQFNIMHRAALKATGLKFRLYDCRHTFATRAVESGVDLLTLGHLLGHSGLNEVTRYAHVGEERKSDAVRRMQQQKAKAV